MPVEHSQVLLGGAVVFWRLAARSDRQKLFDALHSHGLGQFCPDVRTAASALKEALQDYAAESSQRVLIRGLKNPEKDGYLVVNETVGDVDNDYQKLYAVKVNDIGGVEAQGLNTHPNVSRIEALFHQHKAVVTAYAVAKSLVDIVGFYRGTALRPQGGFYWVEDGVLPDLIAAAGSIEQCAVDDSSDIYVIRTAVDSLSVRAIRDAVINEVKQKADEIEAEATTPGLKKRAYQSKQAQAQALHDRVKYFETLLGETLTELHGVADRCETQVVENALLTIPDFLGGLTDLQVQEVA